LFYYGNEGVSKDECSGSLLVKGYIALTHKRGSTRGRELVEALVYFMCSAFALDRQLSLSTPDTFHFSPSYLLFELSRR